MANVLKKPFTKNELNNLITEALEGKEPIAQQEEIKREYDRFTAGKLEEELLENTTYYEELISEIPNEKKVKKVLEKEGQSAFQEFVARRTKELQTAQQTSEEKISTTFANLQQYLEGLLDFFYLGRNLNYPVESYDKGQEHVPAVFLGFIIDLTDTTKIAQNLLPELKITIPKAVPKPILYLIAWFMELRGKLNGKAPWLSVKDIAMFSGLQQDFDISKARNELGFNPKNPDIAVREAMMYLNNKQLMKKGP